MKLKAIRNYRLNDFVTNKIEQGNTYEVNKDIDFKNLYFVETESGTSELHKDIIIELFGELPNTKI